MSSSNYALIFIAAGAAALPLPLIKAYNSTKDKFLQGLYLMASVVSYLILIAIYIVLLKRYSMAAVYPCIKLVSILLVIAIGYLFYEKDIADIQILGIVLGIIAIYLMCK